MHSAQRGDVVTALCLNRLSRRPFSAFAERKHGCARIELEFSSFRNFHPGTASRFKL